VIQIGTYPSRSDAELAQSALAAAGISSVVAADDAGGAYPFDLSGGVRLFVDAADVDDARVILGSPPPEDEGAD
jgi:hypothetical protein